MTLARPERDAPWTRLDLALAVAAALLAIATRAWLRTTAYYSIDAGLLALGALDYDFADYQPHPPYYPLVAGAAHLLSTWMHPLTALTWLAIAASAVMAAGTFAAARALGGRAAGAFAAVVVLASPLALRNGAVPLSYALEGAASAALGVAALWCRRTPGPRPAAVLGAVASLAVGIRPSSLVLLVPVALWAVWGQPRRMAWAAAAGGATTLAWLAPAIAFGGGWHDFLVGVRFQGDGYVLVRPVWDGGWDTVRVHAAWLAHHARRELPVLGALAAAALVAALRVGLAWPRRSLGFLAAWLAPGLVFYLLVYAGWPVYADGYLMGLLPAIAVLAGLAWRALASAVQGEGVPAFARGLGVTLVVALALAPLSWVPAWDDAKADARAAEAWQASLAGLEDAFPSNETAFVTVYAGPMLAWSHPDHLVWTIQPYLATDGLLHIHVRETRGLDGDPSFLPAYDRGRDDAPHAIPANIRRIAILDGHPLAADDAFFVAGHDVQVTRLAGGRDVRWIERGDLATIEEALAYVQAGPQPIERSREPPSSG